MGFDREALWEAVKIHGRVIRVVIAAIKGSSPREVGTAMLVWENGQSGTIGGGTLEFQAAEAAQVANGIHTPDTPCAWPGHGPVLWRGRYPAERNL